MDISGSMQGAGGVAGLCSVQEGSHHFYPSYDGNGNISEYLDSNNVPVAHYEYDAFGNTTVATGPEKDDFLHRFSTKPLDEESGLYYYGYRYYDPVTGRWPSRDPIGERGGVNVYGFVFNRTTSWVDFLGWHPLTADNSSLAESGGPQPSFGGWGKNPGEDNCGSYASNSPGSDPILEELKKQKVDFNNLTCEDIIKAVEQSNHLTQPDDEGCCPEGYHKIHIRVGDTKDPDPDDGQEPTNDKDYHAYRQNSDGNWTHLAPANFWPGGESIPLSDPSDGFPTGYDPQQSVSSVDADGKPIGLCPHDNSHDFETGNYDEDCGVFCAKTR